MNRDAELKAWIKSRRLSADLLMGDTVETLGSSSQMEKTFNELAEQWRNETGMLSVVQHKVINPAYQRIIGMGKQALPFIFKELSQKRDHWVWALRAITGEDVSRDCNSFKEAVEVWIKWGKKKGYL
jgi:hypothetical protein